jgi:hypothetical protein
METLPPPPRARIENLNSLMKMLSAGISFPKLAKSEITGAGNSLLQINQAKLTKM